MRDEQRYRHPAPDDDGLDRAPEVELTEKPMIVTSEHEKIVRSARELPRYLVARVRARLHARRDAHAEPAPPEERLAPFTK